MKTYAELLAIAEATGSNEDWEAVTTMEHAEMAKRCVPEPDATNYLRLNPMCVACAARDTKIKVAATAATRTHGPLCWICLYVLTVTEMGWPIRGNDIDGYPNDPEHPWNKEGKH